MRKKLRVTYDCLNCPGWCCSYTNIYVNASDLRRLAKYFGVSEAVAEKRYCKREPEEGKLILRHHADPYFETVCRFFDTEKRRCTIYEARPIGCRTYPGTRHCGYYNFLMDERDRQDDPDMVLTTDHRP